MTPSSSKIADNHLIQIESLLNLELTKIHLHTKSDINQYAPKNSQQLYNSQYEIDSKNAKEQSDKCWQLCYQNLDDFKATDQAMHIGTKFGNVLLSQVAVEKAKHESSTPVEMLDKLFLSHFTHDAILSCTVKGGFDESKKLHEGVVEALFGLIQEKAAKLRKSNEESDLLIRSNWKQSEVNSDVLTQKAKNFKMKYVREMKRNKN